MLGDQGSPYVGRFARGWHRLPGFVPGQPQTRTGAPREYRHAFTAGASRRGPGGRSVEGAARREHVDLARASLDERCGAGRDGGPCREDVVDQEEPARRRSMRDAREDTRHRPEPFVSGPARLWGRGGRPADVGGRRELEVACQRLREHASLIEAALGPPPGSERYPGHGVGRGRTDLGQSGCERLPDPSPSRELQAMDGLPRRSPIRERRADGCDRPRRAIGAPIDVRARRPAAATAPRRLQGNEGARTRLAEGPRARAAPGARPREQDVDRPSDRRVAHRRTLRRATDTPQGRGTSTGSAPLITIVTTEWVFRSG